MKGAVVVRCALLDVLCTCCSRATMGRSLRQLWINCNRPHVISKFVILGLLSATLACYMSGFPLLFQLGDPKYMVLTHVACSAMLAITGATWAGHVFGQDTPRYLNVAYGVIGGALLLSTSGVCFAAYARRSDLSPVGRQVIPEYFLYGEGMTYKPGTLLAAGLLAMSAGLGYVADVVLIFVLAK